MLVKILEITYAKAKLKQVANNATHKNADDITQLLRILEYFDICFYGAL